RRLEGEHAFLLFEKSVSNVKNLGILYSMVSFGSLRIVRVKACTDFFINKLLQATVIEGQIVTQAVSVI
ncbi:MAG: hypothetical protein ACK55I_01115, partial [bacterium]